MRLILAILIAALPACRKEPPQGKPPEPARRVFQSTLAGRWFEGDPERLRAELKRMIDAVPDKPLEGVCALVLPHAGYRWSGPTAAHGVRHLVGRSFDRVVVIGPSHGRPMENLAHVSSSTHWATPLGEVPLDTEFIDALRRHRCFGSLPGVDEDEHSVQIEVPFLQAALGTFRLVPVVVGRLDAATARTLALILAGMIDARTLVVASSDFTHYGPNYDHVPFKEDIEENLKKVDLGAFEAIKTGRADDFYAYVVKSGPTICGRQAVRVLLEMLPAGAEFHLAKYDTSGRVGGDFANSVSYLSIAVRGAWPKGVAVESSAAASLDEKDRRLLLELARRTLQHRLEKGRSPRIEDLGIEVTEPMRLPRSAFVTLTKGGELRGCIGSLFPTQPLYREVMARAVHAALEDGRFPPVEASELPELHLEISALTSAKPVASPKDIVLGRHGIILEKGGRSAVFLPQVAPEQGWDLPETLRHLSRKAGLPEDAWEKGASFQVFEAEVFGEPKGKRGFRD
jgi:hypothetical protein